MFPTQTPCQILSTMHKVHQYRFWCLQRSADHSWIQGPTSKGWEVKELAKGGEGKGIVHHISSQSYPRGSFSSYFH